MRDNLTGAVTLPYVANLSSSVPSLTGRPAANQSPSQARLEPSLRPSASLPFYAVIVTRLCICIQ